MVLRVDGARRSDPVNLGLSNRPVSPRRSRQPLPSVSLLVFFLFFPPVCVCVCVCVWFQQNSIAFQFLSYVWLGFKVARRAIPAAGVECRYRCEDSMEAPSAPTWQTWFVSGVDRQSPCPLLCQLSGILLPFEFV